ncbi:MAG: ABC transporter substrate-binding protein [Succinivibrionaceae bacterium]|nr:ABC transporter substrate-binding protein [Succinivibrionaceae bacterium]
MSTRWFLAAALLMSGAALAATTADSTYTAKMRISQPSAATAGSMAMMKEVSGEIRSMIRKRESNLAEEKDNLNSIKIVSLAPIVTENLFSLGLKQNVVGVDSMSDYFKPASKLPKVASIDAVNYEEIIRLKPDLIVAWNSFYPNLEKDLERLRIPAKVFRFRTERLLDYSSAILELGRITHAEEESVKIREDFFQQLKQLKGMYQNYPQKSVVYILWDDPIYSVSENTWINDMIETCNGTNPLKGMDQAYPVIDGEYLLTVNPDVIINATVKKEKLNIPGLLHSKVWTMKLVDGTHRISMETLKSTEELCRIIHRADEAGESADMNQDEKNAKEQDVNSTAAS